MDNLLNFKLNTENEITIKNNTVMLIVLMFALIFASFFLIKKIAQ